MSIEKRIENLNRLSEAIDTGNENFKKVVQTAYFHNKWFTEENTFFAAHQISNNYLEPIKLQNWVSNYDLSQVKEKNVGLVLSGNIPFVGLHDVLCSYICGHKTMVKLSSKDEILIKYIIEALYEIDNDVKEKIQIVDRLQNFDAVIATGSNNSARYFKSYFGQYPHIIRKNRNAVAILNGSESEADLLALGIDMFRYFGLGCRNVTKLYFPDNFDIPAFIDVLQVYSDLRDHHKFKNNFDYQLSIHLLNQIKHYEAGFFIMRENEIILSPISVINYSYYSDLDSLRVILDKKSDEIQCIVSNEQGDVSFGQAQNPELNEYADGIDTMAFLLSV